MYHLLVEFGSYSQLRRLKAAVLERAIASIEAVLEHARARPLSISGGRRLYRFEANERSDPQAVAERSVEAFEALSAYRDDLAGYTFLVAYDSSSTAEALREQLTDMLLGVTDDESLLIAASAYPSLADHLQCDRQGSLRKVTGRRGSGRRGTEDVRDVAVHPRVVEAGIEAISEWLAGAAPALLCIRGNDLDGARYTAEEILRRLQGARGAWLTIHGDTARRDGVRALATSLESAGISQTHHYLNAAERHVWADKLPLLQRLYGGAPPLLNDRLVEDFQRGYALYLLAYARRMVLFGQSPFVLVHRYDLLGQSAIDLLDAVLSSIEERTRPLVVATCGIQGQLRRLGELRRVELRLFELTTDEFMERLDSSLSDATKRLVRVREAHERTGGHLVLLHHYVVLLQQRSRSDASADRPEREQISYAVTEKLSQREREILFVAGLWHGRGPIRRFTELLEWIGFDGAAVSEEIRRLSRLGLISDEERCSHTFDWLQERLKSMLGQRTQQLARAVATWFLGEVEAGRFETDPELTALLSKFEERASVTALYRNELNELLDRRDLEAARIVFQEPMPLSGTHAESESIRDIATVARARYLLLQGKHEDAYRLLRDSTISDSTYGAEAALQRGRALFAAGNVGEAHKYIKRSIILYQEMGDTRGAVAAGIDFGVCVLAADHVADARNYLAGTRDMRPYEWLRSLLYRTVALFLHGSYTRVKEACLELETHAASSGLREFELFALFVSGRTHFELGQYEEGAAELSRLLTGARLYRFDEALRTGALWLARCFIYLGLTKHAHALLDRYGGSAEALLFRAEAYEFEGRMRDALECTRSGQEAENAPVVHNIEHVNWSTGFATIEDLVVREEPVLSRLFWAYDAYLTARSESTEDGVESLQELTRSRSVAESDPFNRIYFFLYSEVLAQSESMPDDRGTVLGKSVRFVQDRASRIDNYSDKIAFLHKNYWNGRIVTVARNHNLFA